VSSLVAYSGEIPVGLPLLAAHLYYRALLSVPLLVRNWLLDCRDRQLLSTVTSYTSAHFSPAIIRAELAQVKDPALTADLADDTFTVKVATAISEITAAFTVDEYSLELKLRLPQDFPLHNIVTTDSNRVGVAENSWRAWILGVQQILTFRVRLLSLCLPP
jgi:E3 ubiquitin-protein ligase listerin